MCGICGKIPADRSAPVGEGLVRAMTRALAHRGPDGEGLAAGPGFGLGHRRLAVIDLSERARQPLANETGTLLLVFNGEIYNFRELRRGLEAEGHAFRSDTDSEVILHLYEEAGERCVERLRGMFAFALYDKERHTLFAARDRVGKKPFLYAEAAGAFYFASEFRALLESGEVAAVPDPEALYHYLSLGYVPAPWTAFRGIRKLPPGHRLRYAGGKVTVEPYWRLSFAGPMRVEGRRGEAAVAEELRERLRGAFLSGGVDSSAVVALMGECAPGRVRTFTMGFEEGEYDETPHARRVAERFGTEHTEAVVRPDAAALLPKLVEHYGEPFADASAVPSFYLSEMTAAHVKVVLNGDGGDELFGGYLRYKAHALAEGAGKVLPPALVRLLCRAGLAFLPRKAGSGVGAAWRIRRLLRHAHLPPARRNFQWSAGIDEDLKAELLAPAFLERAGAAPTWRLMEEGLEASDAPDLLGKILDLDLRTYLPGDLLVKMDIATMAHGLEARSPLLDPELAAFAARLPASLKLKGWTSKYILKKALAPLVPGEVLRRPKQGFGVPIDAWLRGPLLPMLRDLLLSRRAAERGIFKTGAVEDLIAEHASGRENRHAALWTLLVLELWFRRFVDRR